MSRRLNTCLALTGSAILFACLLIAVQPPPSKPPDEPVPPPVTVPVLPEHLRQQLRQRAEEHFISAEQAAETAHGSQLGVLQTFFDDARQRTPAFAATALSFDSKWRYLTDTFPGNTGESHAQLLESKFQEYLFTPEALEQLIRQLVEAYLTELENIDYLLLIEIAADLEDLPQLLPFQPVDRSQLEAACEELRAKVREHVIGDLQADVGQTLASIVAGEIFTAVAARMGVSAGILGAGAATSWTTLGAGFIVGLIVDEIVAWIWNWWADPRGSLVRELNRQLTDLEAQIVEGTPERPGLRWHLQDIARRRTVVRRRSVLELLDSGDSP